MRRAPAVAATSAVLVALAACGSGSSPRERSAPAQAKGARPAAQKIDPADFVRRVDNPWYPLVPGTTYRWRGGEGTRAADVLTVTRRTKVILGVTTTVVRDRFYVNGKVKESTTDWFAQDRHGTVWYFGEATKQLDRSGRVVSTEGSWQAGVDGAEAGIYMPHDPRVGQVFRQEHYKGHAEDRFEIVSLNASVRVPYVSSQHAMRTKETTPLEPGVIDAKYYVRGVGNVLEETVKGPEKERLGLVSVTRR